MNESKTFTIRKTRSKMEIFSTSFQYIFSHMRSLGLALIGFSLPLILLSIIAAYTITGNGRGFDNLINYKRVASKESFIFLLVAFAVYIVGMAVLNITINRHVLIQDKEEENSPTLLFDKVKENFMTEFKNSLLNFFIIFVIYYIISQLLNYFFSGSSGWGYIMFPESAFDYFIKLCILFLPYIIALPFVFYFCFSALFVSQRDNIGSTDALKKVWDISQTNIRKVWTSSAIFLSIAVIALFVVQFFFSLLQGLMWSLTTFNSNFMFILYLLQTLVTFFMAVYMNVATIILFGSIEDEKEGYYIKSKIDKI